MIKRPRRLRTNNIIRNMTRETKVNKSSLIYPIFVKEGEGIKEEINKMDGQYRYSVDKLLHELEEISNSGIKSVLL